LHIPGNNPIMDWQEEPATNQQLLRLKSYGFVPTCALTITQAARLIRQFSKHPSGASAQPEVPPAFSPAPASHPVAQTYEMHAPDGRSEAPLFHAHSVLTGASEETASSHAHRLHLAVKAAQQTVARNPDRLGVRADLRSAILARQQFWLDTCHDHKDPHAISQHALEFHRHYGAAFFPPTFEEVQEVLEALDAAMPEWDQHHPELFYEALKLNFPSLLKHH
jgi:hypothetical protein